MESRLLVLLVLLVLVLVLLLLLLLLLNAALLLLLLLLLRCRMHVLNNKLHPLVPAQWGEEGGASASLLNGSSAIDRHLIIHEGQSRLNSIYEYIRLAG